MDRRIGKNRAINLCGEVFGKLTVIRRAANPNNQRKAAWLCRCACGKEKVVIAQSLVNNRTKSCGCGSLDYIKWNGFGEICNWFWNNIKQSAKARGHLFEISIEEGWELFLKQQRKCALSGLPLCFAHKNRDRGDQTASLDRINSSKGYDINNVQWVHKDINYIKQDYEESYFKYLCRLVTERVDSERLV